MSIFTQFIKSLYSTKDIAKFRFQGIGKTILYVFLLVLVSTIPTGYIMSTELVNGARSIERIFATEIPSFQIEDGVLTSENKEPFIREEDNFVFVLDSTDSTSVADVKNYRNSLALLKNEIILTTNYQSESLDYSMFEEFVLNEDNIIDFIQTFQSLLPIVLPVMLLFLYIVTSGLKFIEIAILGFIGLLFKNSLGLKLKYRHTWILAVYSMTIPTVFFTIMEALRIQVPFGGALNWFVSSIVLFLALREIPRPKSSN